MADTPNGPAWNPFVVFGVLIGILLLFFIFLSFPSLSGCPERRGYETDCR